MKKSAKKKPNFGWGRQLKYAARKALTAHYGEGKYGSVNKNFKNFCIFIVFLKNSDITNANHITLEMFIQFSAYIFDKKEDGRYTPKVAQNIISSVNMTMTAFRYDKKIWLSPVKTVGHRIDRRQTPPAALDTESVKKALWLLTERGHNLDVLLINFILLTGVRLKEACLQNYRNRLKEALTTGEIDITEGTKGGRGKYVKRLIAATPEIILVMKELVKYQGDHKSVIPVGTKSINFMNRFYSRWYRAAHQFGLKGFHDLRAAHACFLYASMTGYLAPIIDSENRAPKELDLEARQAITNILGHGRTDITNAYIGGQR